MRPRGRLSHKTPRKDDDAMRQGDERGGGGGDGEGEGACVCGGGVLLLPSVTRLIPVFLSSSVSSEEWDSAPRTRLA